MDIYSSEMNLFHLIQLKDFFLQVMSKLLILRMPNGFSRISVSVETFITMRTSISILTHAIKRGIPPSLLS